MLAQIYHRVPDVARILDVSEKTVRRMISEKLIRVVRLRPNGEIRIGGRGNRKNSHAST